MNTSREVTAMKRKLETCLLAFALAVPGLALAGASLSIRDLASTTGLSERQVQMVLGGRTAYAEYRTSYDRVERHFIEALGEDRYRDLMAGREIVLDNGARFALLVK
jgi:hypothetical protein